MNVLKSPGLWIFVAGLEMLFLTHMAEMLYPGYSVSDDVISKLGVGPTASKVMFTTGVIVFGLLSLVCAGLLHERNKRSWIWLLLSLSGVGAVGVGAFNMDSFSEVHAVFAVLAFLFGNLAVLYSYKLVRPPLSYSFALLGLIGLAALALMGSRTYLGLGYGGMERMVFYPAMFWAIAFGAILLADDARTVPA
jgi:hypothetical membrane protein